MQMYMLNFTNEMKISSDNPESKSNFEICFENSIIGINSESDADTLSIFRRVRKGDYIWLRTNDEYYIAYVTGTIATADESYKEYGIGYYIKCNYYLVGAELPSEISFCKDMLSASSVIKEIEYDKNLFEFTKKFISKNNKTALRYRTKEFLKRNRKRFLLILSVALLAVAAIFFSVRTVQYVQNQSYVSSTIEELKGKTYIYYDTDYDFMKEYKVLEFDENGKYRYYRLYMSEESVGFVNGEVNREYRYSASYDSWEDVDSKIEFFSAKFSILGYYKPDYNKHTATLTLWSGQKYELLSETNNSHIENMYKLLLTYRSSDRFNDAEESDKENAEQIIETIEGYKLFDSNVIKNDLYADLYIDRAIDGLKEIKVYSISVSEILNECVRNMKFKSFEYDEENHTCYYAYTCEYAPNKINLPNYYISGGEFIITYNTDTDVTELRTPDELYDAFNLYAALKTYN